MKKDIHPDYHNITIKSPSGKSFNTRSVWGQEGDTLQLDVDPTTHPAWTGNAGTLKKTGQMEKFNSRFGGLDFKKAKAGDAA
jgi:large subunit ribosomal protein L31